MESFLPMDTAGGELILSNRLEKAYYAETILKAEC